mgnify:FL=1
MGSSTASETTTNTSTDSSNTVYTMVTVTDAEQEEKLEHDLLENKSLMKKDEKYQTKQAKENFESKRELKDHKKIQETTTTRTRNILSEFDELFLENEKRINADKKLRSKTNNNKTGMVEHQEIQDDNNSSKGTAVV